MNTPQDKQKIFLWLAALIMPVAALVGIAIYLGKERAREQCEAQRAANTKIHQIDRLIHERGQAPSTVDWDDVPLFADLKATPPDYEVLSAGQRYKFVFSYYESAEGPATPFSTYDSATGRWDRDLCAGR